MTNKAIPYNELVEGVLDLLKSKGYMESTLTVYRRTYYRIRAVLRQCGTDIYTPEIGEKFLAGTNVKKSAFDAYTCAIRRLNDFIEGKPFRSHHGCPCIQTPPEFSWLGHSDISTTSNIYTHLDYSSKVASAQAIVGILQSDK